MVAPQQSKTNSPFDNPDEYIGNSAKKSKLKWWLLLVLLLLVGFSASVAAGDGIKSILRTVGIQGVPGPAGEAGLDGIDGKDGLDGVSSFSSATSDSGGTSGQNGADGAPGAPGADGAAGATGSNGTNGTNGADGADGTNACISGLCVSRQTTSPGTQETGNINIDGAVLAGSITTTSDATIGADATINGHLAIGSGVTVDGGATPFDGLGGITGHSSTITGDEIITDFSDVGIAHDAIFAFARANPSSATSAQINGINGGVVVESGNSEDFSGQLQGINGVTVHGGTGLVSTLNGIQGITGSTGGGSIDYATGINVLTINLSGAINNNRGIRVGTPINAGTIVNNYGLYIEDQSSVGSTLSYNLYSAGATAKNYFAGLVGIGADTTPDASLEIVNDGSGDSFLVADTNDGDTSPFVIDSDGQVGIGTTALGNRKLRVDGAIEASKVFFRAGADNDLYSSIFYDGADNMKYTAYDAHAFFTETGSGLTQKMIIDGGGNVGIGVDTPGVKLDVNGVIRGTRFSGVSGSTTWLSSDGSATGLFVTDAANPQTGANRSFHITANGGQAVPAFSVTGGSIGQIVALVKGAPSQTANLQEWQNSSDTPVGYVTATGTLAQSGATNCAVSANASGELQCTSDERLKDVQGLYDGGLEQLNSINTIRYNFKNEDYTHVGFSAQNVGAVLPEGTPLQANGFLGLDSNAILALTVNSVKELDLEVDTLGVDFASLLEQTQGDVDGATQLLANQGLQLDQLSQTLQDYATQLSALSDRVDSLEAEVRILGDYPMTASKKHIV